MNSQAARGLYLTVGAALGALAIRAIAARRQQRTESDGAAKDVSSRVGPHALAPETDAMGDELVDPSAIEVPIGQSADAEIDTHFSRTKLPQADSTGASLQREDVGTGVQEVSVSLYGGDTNENLTARPNQQVMPTDDAYDAVAPDDLGSEWLARATGVSQLESIDTTSEEQPPEAFLEDAMSVVSEASINAANPDEIESNASSDLDEDYIPVDLDELRGKENK